MFVVGFATAVEIVDLKDQGFEVEDAPAGCVGPSVEECGEGYLLAKPEAGPNGTKAVAVFLDAALHDVLLELLSVGDFMTTIHVPDDKLDVEAFVARKQKLVTFAREMLADAEDFKHCSHKNPDGSDARYPTGNGETACICGNKWD